MESTDQPADHLAEAALAAKVAGGMLGAGHFDSAERWTRMAGVHAQIAQAEQARRLSDLFDPMVKPDNATLSTVEVEGELTTGRP